MSDHTESDHTESDHTEVPRRRRGIALTVGVIAALLVAAGGYWAGTAAVDPTASEEYMALQASLDHQEDRAQTLGEEKAANTISNGTWTVGVDIAAGTYRSNEPVGATCYWGIYRTGTNGGDIIENDIPGGGRPTVTLSQGQDFNSTRCGSWTKQ